MQPLTWYARRLRAMSLPEVGWRLRAHINSSIDRCLARWRQRPLDTARILNGHGDPLTVCGEVVGLDLPTAGPADVSCPAVSRWREALLRRAEAISRNRLDLFDLEDLDLGAEIDWNYEYKARKQTPLTFAPAIDYRSYEQIGDCKFVWELNRHQHWVVLGRAFRLTGDRRYADTVLKQLDSWIQQCPYGTGVNWRSPLELGIRLINWVWALELIRPGGLMTAALNRRLLGAVYGQLREISRKYSRYSSANNHLIGEAAGVYVASGYFGTLRGASRRRQRSRAILLNEIIAQTWPDGGNREQAMGYHLFTLELFLLAGLAARNIGEDFPEAYWARLEKMFEYLAAFMEGGDSPPMFGDNDDGYVLDLDEPRNRAGGLLAVGAALFDRSDFKALAGKGAERVFWLLGPRAFSRFEHIPTGAGHLLVSRALPHSGYYLLQSGHRGAEDRISLTFDCGELGFGAISAHGHADALSFTLRAFNHDILVDPGTYDYFTYARWRDYFRSTPAHNTVVIDGRDQSQMLGSFLWGRRARARCVAWEPSASGGRVVGEHDGYAGSAGPVMHRRTVILEGQSRRITIRDELNGPGRHEAASYLHFSERCSVQQVGRNRLAIDCPRGRLSMEMDPALSVSIAQGSLEPISGWVSRGYHRKEPGSTLKACCTWENHLLLDTTITLK